MNLKALAAVCKMNGKISKEEKKAGVLLKLLQMPNGYWLCWVDVSCLMADNHQRVINMKHATNIVGEFNAKCVSVPTCTLRDDGKMENEKAVYVEDGQHTVQVLLAVSETESGTEGMTQVVDGKLATLCWVHTNVTRKQAADIFFVKNTSRRNMDSWVAFNAGHTAGRAINVLIIEEAHKNKLKTPLSIKTEEVSDLEHWAEYIKIVKAYSYDFFAELMTLHAQCLKGSYVNRELLKGLIKHLKSHKMTPKALIPYMKGKKNLARQLDEKAREYTNNPTSRPGPKAYAEAIQDLVGPNRMDEAA